MAQRMPCFICTNSLIPKVMVRIFGEKNNLKRDIAIRRRDEAERPAMIVTPETRICNNCNISITREMRVLDDDPNCLRLNVLSQTSSNTCLVCNHQNNLHLLTLECKTFIFIHKNIYVQKKTKSCYDHLDERGFLKPSSWTN